MNMKINQKQKSYVLVIKKAVGSYFSETTVHGFRYIVEGGNKCEKWSWAVLIIASLMLSTYIIHKSFKDWIDTPLQTTIKQVSMPIEELDQPAITVCNPDELQMPLRNRWTYIERILNWIDVDRG